MEAGNFKFPKGVNKEFGKSADVFLKCISKAYWEAHQYAIFKESDKRYKEQSLTEQQETYGSTTALSLLNFYDRLVNNTLLGGSFNSKGTIHDLIDIVSRDDFSLSDDVKKFIKKVNLAGVDQEEDKDGNYLDYSKEQLVDYNLKKLQPLLNVEDFSKSYPDEEFFPKHHCDSKIREKAERAAINTFKLKKMLDDLTNIVEDVYEDIKFYQRIDWKPQLSPDITQGVEQQYPPDIVFSALYIIQLLDKLCEIQSGPMLTNLFKLIERYPTNRIVNTYICGLYDSYVEIPMEKFVEDYRKRLSFAIKKGEKKAKKMAKENEKREIYRKNYYKTDPITGVLR